MSNNLFIYLFFIISLNIITSSLLLLEQHLFCHATGSEVTRMLQTQVEEEYNDLTTKKERRKFYLQLIILDCSYQLGILGRIALGL